MKKMKFQKEKEEYIYNVCTNILTCFFSKKKKIGLFYTMWMSDKALVQEELSNKLASLLSSFNTFEGFFFFCFLEETNSIISLRRSLLYWCVLCNNGQRMAITRQIEIRQVKNPQKNYNFFFHCFSRFYFLMRTIQLESLRMLAQLKWSKDAVKAYSEILIRL